MELRKKPSVFWNGRAKFLRVKVRITKGRKEIKIGIETKGKKESNQEMGKYASARLEESKSLSP